MILRGLDRFPTMESMLEFGCDSQGWRGEGREGEKEGEKEREIIPFGSHSD